VTGPIALATGGTGGHLFAAVALAGELSARGRSVHVLTDARVEVYAAQVPSAEIHNLRAGRLGGGPLRAALGLAQLAAGAVEARRLLRRLAPAAVVGFGGYASVPAMLAAATLGVPTMIHEQNAVLGRANRLLAPRAARIATGFAETAGLRPADRVRAVHTGNPVRPAILTLGEVGYTAPSPHGKIELLVLGGSQGAHIMAEIVPAALAMLPEALRVRLGVSQQARPEDRAMVVAAYAESGISAAVASFFEDVPQRLERAHLAICRAGASTLAELGAIGRPALLIPYPHATDDHQTANARAFAGVGGGRVLAQAGLRPETLAAELKALLADPPTLSAMARRAAAFGRRDAARRLALLALALEPDPALRECAA
jgi:UDP-N-acetylglucosamine--N-acetylmuramyl-(pentapeptide) pyrophosphoryl-undecaprenol N-acetylglucosamine transferase